MRSVHSIQTKLYRKTFNSKKFIPLVFTHISIKKNFVNCVVKFCQVLLKKNIFLFVLIQKKIKYLNSTTHRQIFLVMELNETHYKRPGGINIFFRRHSFSVAFSRQYNYYSMAFALLLHARENICNRNIIFTIVFKLNKKAFTFLPFQYQLNVNMQYGKEKKTYFGDVYTFV